MNQLLLNINKYLCRVKRDLSDVWSLGYLCRWIMPGLGLRTEEQAEGKELEIYLTAKTTCLQMATNLHLKCVRVCLCVRTTDGLLGKILDIHVCVCGQLLQHWLHLCLQGTAGTPQAVTLHATHPTPLRLQAIGAPQQCAGLPAPPLTHTVPALQDRPDLL